MTWVVKIRRKDPSYLFDDAVITWTPSFRGALRYDRIADAMSALWRARATWTGEPLGISRIVKRKRLDEAAIRRSERERIASMVHEQGILICISHKPVGEIAHLDNCSPGKRGAEALRSAILSADWPARP